MKDNRKYKQCCIKRRQLENNQAAGRQVKLLNLSITKCIVAVHPSLWNTATQYWGKIMNSTVGFPSAHWNPGFPFITLTLPYTLNQQSANHQLLWVIGQTEPSHHIAIEIGEPSSLVFSDFRTSGQYHCNAEQESKIVPQVVLLSHSAAKTASFTGLLRH